MLARVTNWSKKAIVITMTALSAVGYVACSEEDTPEVTSSVEVEPMTPQVVSNVLDNGDERTATISSVTSTSNVTGGIAGFESQGFTFIDSNSLVMTRTEYITIPDPALPGNNTDPVAGKNVPGPENVSILHADTIVWLAFENPTHDMANHAALVTIWRNEGPKRTARIQLDVSVEIPSVIEEGLIIGGEFSPGDIGTSSWGGCVFGGLVGTGVVCLFTNCAYAACVGIGVAGTLAGCTATWAWDNWF